MKSEKTEVSFEKRGKSQDHQPCPVCKCCLCWCGGNHVPKKILPFLFLTFLLLPFNLAFAQPVIPYTVKTTEEIIGAVDVNSKGEWIKNVQGPNGLTGQVTLNKGRKWASSHDISCGGDTGVEDLNNRSKVVGGCTLVNFGERKWYGYVWNAGQLELLDAPGSDGGGTTAYAIADNNMIGGQYYGPVEWDRSGFYRINAFVKHGSTYFLANFPRADTYTNLWGVNQRGKALLEFCTFNPLTNEGLGCGWAIYDNGQFTILPFPNNIQQGPDAFVIGPNRDDQLLVIRTNGDENWNGIFLYDDNQLFEVGLPFQIDGLPTRWDVRGLVEDGEVFGTYSVMVGTRVCPPEPSFCTPDIWETHGFIATPTL